MNGEPSSRAAIRLGGWSLVVAAVGFLGVFGWLSARFGYPDVLDGAAPDVLPRLLSLGATGRAVWVIYSLLPLLLIPAGIAVLAALRPSSPNAARGAMVGAVIASVSMLLGLARWPSVHWEMARAYGAAGPEARQAMDALFLGLNVYLGNFIGEFLGELTLNLFFFATGVAGLRSAPVGRWFAYAGMAVGVIGWIAALRNTTRVVAPIAEIENYLLPIWMVVLGVTLIRWRASAAGPSPMPIREAA